MIIRIIPSTRDRRETVLIRIGHTPGTHRAWAAMTIRPTRVVHHAVLLFVTKLVRGAILEFGTTDGARATPLIPGRVHAFAVHAPVKRARDAIVAAVRAGWSAGFGTSLRWFHRTDTPHNYERKGCYFKHGPGFLRSLCIRLQGNLPGYQVREFTCVSFV